MPHDAMEYSPEVWAHFRTPRNTGAFPVSTERVFRGQAGVRQHGREVEFQLQISTADRIADCRYRVYGCPATIALCSLTSEALKGLSLGAAASFSVVALTEQFDLPAEKRPAALTIEDAIRAAVAGYNTQRQPHTAAGHEAKQA